MLKHLLINFVKFESLLLLLITYFRKFILDFLFVDIISKQDNLHDSDQIIQENFSLPLKYIKTIAIFIDGTQRRGSDNHNHEILFRDEIWLTGIRYQILEQFLMETLRRLESQKFNQTCPPQELLFFLPLSGSFYQGQQVFYGQVEFLVNFLDHLSPLPQLILKCEILLLAQLGNLT